MPSKVLSLWISIGVAIATVLSAFAEGPSPSGDADPLLASIQRLAQRPTDPARAVDAARERLLASIGQLEQFLAGGGSGIASRWSQWLRVSALKAEIASGEPDIGALRSIEERFYQNQLGLELPVFVAVRRELRAFLAASAYATADLPQELYHQRLAELSECLARLAAQPAETDANRAGSILAWLESVNADSAALARDARERLCRTNGLAQVSGRLANVLLRRNVQERNYIAETVLGSFTRGIAITQGQLLLGTVPSQEQGTLEIRLRGQVTCPANVADRRRISVLSSAYTSLDAKKQVSIDEQGLHLSRAAASCATNLEIQDIEARSRILERVAWRRAGRLAPEAEGLASQRAESEAASKLDQQADASLGGINDMFCQKFRAPLIRLDALPAKMQFWTDQSHLRLSLSQHNELQLAAAGPPPSLPSSYDLAGCVHESMINNLCEALLGERTIQDEAWLEMMHLLTRTPPRALWVHDRAERWAVKLAKQRPVIARFEQDRLIEVRQGERVFKQSIEIEARFIPQITRDGPALVRDGDLVVRFTDQVGTENEASLRAFLVRRFGAVFPPELSFSGLIPPAGGSLGKLRLLQTAEFRSATGWLTLGYELAP